ACGLLPVGPGSAAWARRGPAIAPCCSRWWRCAFPAWPKATSGRSRQRPGWRWSCWATCWCLRGQAPGGARLPPRCRARVEHGTAAGPTGAGARTGALHLPPVTRDPAMPFVPAEISHVFAAVLVVTSFLTSALTAAMGLGGGVAMLAVLSLGLPVTSVL